MATKYVAKTAAVTGVMQATGAGRFIIEKKMTELEASGRIKFIDDPRDSRRKLITKEHVEDVIRALSL
jgi:hypothetical protein